MRDKLRLNDRYTADVTYAPTLSGQLRRFKAYLRSTSLKLLVAETLGLRGVYTAECYGADGVLKWSDTFKNTVVTVGQNLSLDTILGGSAYTVTGPFMGLISSTSFTAIAAADTMASHGGWLEAGNAHAPTYSGTRTTAAFSAAAAGAKATSASQVFNITGSGTVKGAFMVFGTGAVNTIDDTNGTLLSAGLFSGGDKIVANGDVVKVNYTLSG